MAVGDIYEVRWIFNNTLTGKRISTAHHVREDAGAVDPVATIQSESRDWWETDDGAATSQDNRHTPEIEFAQVRVQRVRPTVGLAAEANFDPVLLGQSAGDLLANQASMLLSLRSALAGRSNRGRMYLPPPSEADVVDGVVGDGFADQNRQRFNAYRLSLATSFMTVGIKSDVGGGSFSPVVTVLADRRVRTQRKRQLRSALYT